MNIRQEKNRIVRWAAASLASALLAACGGGGGGGGGAGGISKIPTLVRTTGGGAFEQAPGPTSCAADSAEPNDEIALRKALTFNQPRALNFCDDGVDFFTLAVTPGQSFTVETSALEGAADTTLEVLRPDGQVITSNDDSGNTLASSAQVTVPAEVNEVVIAVRQFTGNPTGVDTGYVLTARNAGQASLPDFNFNDFTLSGFADTRTFEFSATVANSGTGFGTPAVAFYLSTDAVFNRNQDRLFAETLAGQIAPGGTTELTGFLSVPEDAIGEFIIFLVLDDQNLVQESSETNNATPLSGPTRLFPQAAGNCHDDSFEPDDTSAQAKRINPGDHLNARHCADDLDIFFFEARAGSSYTVSTTNFSRFTDTLLEITDQAGTVLASNDDHAGKDSRVNVTVASDQLLDIRVVSRNGFGASGAYTLNLTENDNRPDLVASVIGVSPNLVAGRQATLTIRIANGGGTAAAPSHVGVDLFCNPVNALDRGYEFAEGLAVGMDIAVPQLAAGAFVTLTPQVQIPAGASGACEFYSFADSASLIVESVDSNGAGGLALNAGSVISATIAAGTTAKLARPLQQSPPALERHPERFTPAEAAAARSRKK